ncbi:MAG: type II toxin-antitoxin system RelE/ParE family toxin [Clostridia bacterium]|jgi:mRNA interferase RelE/StbE|nr:type II toxin-antitoxin system RelE/ParE family toxin [Clostridia bacterium]MDD4542202.1 type II toxin-antitoxin system RelE/ParE family toxin [Clostridia bacterium]HPJ76019.1 type II toxin-antitoxin system RelE/ParE family toxin [Clostridia bacterium]HXK71844.1 type II toxin-antitoxin system RelE/ParE family toxin [Clostridia bacterium]
MYEIRFTASAERYFKKVKEKRLLNEYYNTIKKISINPYIGEMKKGDLAGVYCYDIYYNRTNYEIAYMIYEQEKRMIVVVLAGTRENFYQELKRYIKDKQ